MLDGLVSTHPKLNGSLKPNEINSLIESGEILIRGAY
jgi:hypothetical protein